MFLDPDNYEATDDLDVPRVTQWEDEESEGAVVDELEDDLSEMPLGVLRRAQHIVSQDQDKVNVEDSDTSDEGEGPYDGANSKGNSKGMFETNSKLKPTIAKRCNKHAPTEITSKKPVTRKRAVVEVQAVQTRDPRFLPLAGEFSAENFRAQYGFLADAHKAELNTLRENLKRARKLLANSPRISFDERDKEVKRLELAVKRAESMVNKDRQDMTEREALLKLTSEEKEKRNQGKQHWWLKESEKRNVLMRARYEALAADGGGRAVKRAMEKKQKKVGQKEKKSRPFPRGAFRDGARRHGFEADRREEEGQPSSKRRRVDK